jgi:hypothetical protein
VVCHRTPFESEATQWNLPAAGEVHCARRARLFDPKNYNLKEQSRCMTSNKKIKRRIYASNQGMIDPVKMETLERLLIKE